MLKMSLASQGPKYVLRFDDVAPTMRWNSFSRARDIMAKYQVKPLIAVVPENKDPDLDFEKKKKEFWSEIRDLQKNGWAIGLHGYEHLAHTDSPGMLGTLRLSEFAGRPLEEQLDTLRKAKQIFDQNSVEIDGFVAPFQSFDKNTVSALNQLQLKNISDGIGLFPYRKNGMTFVPQLMAKPSKMPVGVFTFCLHLNTFNEEDFDKLEEFIAENQQKIISFQQATQLVSGSFFNRLIGQTIYFLLRIRRFLRGFYPSELRKKLAKTNLAPMLKRLPTVVYKVLDQIGVLPFFAKRLSPARFLDFLRSMNPFATRGVEREYFERQVMTTFAPTNGDVVIIGYHHANVQYSYFYHYRGCKTHLVDIKETSQAFAGKGIPYVCSAEEISNHLDDHSVAVVEFNGVYGFGINDEEQLKATIATFHRVLKKDGYLLFGHNTIGGNPLSMERDYQKYFGDFTEVHNDVVPKIIPGQIFRVFQKR